MSIIQLFVHYVKFLLYSADAMGTVSGPTTAAAAAAAAANM